MTPVVQKHTGDLDKSKGSEERSNRGGRKRRKGDSFEKSDRAAEVWAGARAEPEGRLGLTGLCGFVLPRC